MLCQKWPVPSKLVQNVVGPAHQSARWQAWPLAHVLGPGRMHIDVWAALSESEVVQQPFHLQGIEAHLLEASPWLHNQQPMLGAHITLCVPTSHAGLLTAGAQEVPKSMGRVQEIEQRVCAPHAIFLSHMLHKPEDYIDHVPHRFEMPPLQLLSVAASHLLVHKIPPAVQKLEILHVHWWTACCIPPPCACRCFGPGLMFGFNRTSPTDQL